MKFALKQKKDEEDMLNLPAEKKQTRDCRVLLLLCSGV